MSFLWLAKGLQILLESRLAETKDLRYYWKTPFISNVLWDSAESESKEIAANITHTPQEHAFTFVSHNFTYSEEYQPAPLPEDDTIDSEIQEDLVELALGDRIQPEDEDEDETVSNAPATSLPCPDTT